MSDPLHPAHALLTRAHPPAQAAAIFRDKVQHRPLFLRPTSPDPTSHDARAARRRQRLHKKAYQLRKQKPRRLSAKERRRLGVHDVPENPEMRRWELYVPLQRMWMGYMQELLGIQPWSADGMDGVEGESAAKDEGGSGSAGSGGIQFVTGVAVGPKLASADYHGAELEVVRSNCTSRVGVRGIVLKDTKFTFEIVTRENEVKTIPKKQTIFRFEVPRVDLGPMPMKPGDKMAKLSTAGPRPFVFEIHGSQFEVRAVDRATKKFKPRRMDYL